jgi:hypothetical protein
MYSLTKSYNAFITVNPHHNLYLNSNKNLKISVIKINNSKLNLQKLDRNTKITIDIIGVSLYSYLLNHYQSINYPIVVVYAFVLYYLSLYLIYQLK